MEIDLESGNLVKSRITLEAENLETKFQQNFRLTTLKMLKLFHKCFNFEARFHISYLFLYFMNTNHLVKIDMVTVSASAITITVMETYDNIQTKGGYIFQKSLQQYRHSSYRHNTINI